MQKEKKVNFVYGISLLITIAIVLWCLFIPENFEAVANYAFEVLTKKFGWLYMFSVAVFLIFSIWIGFSKYGKIRLGADDSKPDYSTVSWFAMLFSAGMGIGLIFWGVAEPLNHYLNPLGADPATPLAAEFAMRTSFVHWTLHPWGIFTVMGLALAYVQFRRGKSGLISNVFIPLLGEERVNGWIGKTIDILAVFATVAGVTTSLGLGTMQINSGLNHLFGVPETHTAQVLIICVVSSMFICSAVSGIDLGIKILSNINMLLAFLLLAMAFIVGPSVMMLNSFAEGVGEYLQWVVRESFVVGAFQNNDWFAGWRVFYWAWWIAWAPFVGSFIARISKGRTIREFVIGVLLVPSLLSFIWFSVFGNMGINLGAEVAAEAIKTTSTAAFIVFAHYPLGVFMSGVTIALVCTFFVTSADSATFVLGIFTSEGDLNPGIRRKVVWGLVNASLALVLLLGSKNGLQMLQTVSIVGAFPFIFILIGASVAVYKYVSGENLLTRSGLTLAGAGDDLSGQHLPVDPKVTAAGD
ncbi:MAG: BCCT family transporter [Synergistaceae bacterium]|jgi:glycine betaine transporter|nr:BCCT family transporter [Synergistaceae bacterium]